MSLPNSAHSREWAVFIEREKILQCFGGRKKPSAENYPDSDALSYQELSNSRIIIKGTQKPQKYTDIRYARL